MARDAEGWRLAALNTGRLPVRLAPLVGRQRELQDVVDALARSRLLSLTGPGGTGKTRLALAAADAARGRFPGGVYWVELAPIDDPAIAAHAVADRLGVPEVPGQDATATIAEHIGDRPMLLGPGQLRAPGPDGGGPGRPPAPGLRLPNDPHYQPRAAGRGRRA